MTEENKEIKQDHFMFFANFSEAIMALPEEERSEAYRAICEFGIYGILPKNQTLRGMCIMSKASIYKKERRGGLHNPTGKNQHSQEVKTGQSGQSGQTGQPFKELKQETETEYKKETNKEKSDSVDNSTSQNPVNSFIKNKILVSSQLSLLSVKDEDFNLYIKEYGKKVILDVQNWLVKNKDGKWVDKQFICRQFNNFASRQRK